MSKSREELAAFLKACLDEDENGIRDCLASGEPNVSEHDLDDIEAKRRIVGLCETETPETGGLPLAQRTLRLLAVPYADRPGYKDAWRP